MNLEIVYFREEQEYSREEIFRLLRAETSEDQIVAIRFLRYLQDLGGLVRRKSEIQPEYDMSQESIAEGGYVFKYVGVMDFEDRFLIICYPKYIHLKNNEAPPKLSVQLVLRSLEHYAYNQSYSLDEACDAVDAMSRQLALNLFLIRDWLENGIYRKTHEYLEKNGTCEIDWETTINTTIPVLQDGAPYYLKYYTNAIEDVENSYISRLHRGIVSLAAEQLVHSHIAEIMDVDLPVLSECALSDFGDEAYIINRLHQELGMQFGNRQQQLLKMLLAWMEKSRTINNTSMVSFFGTTNYELLWQDMCEKVFNDVRMQRLDTIGFKLRDPFNLSLQNVYDHSVESLLDEHARMHGRKLNDVYNLNNMMPRPQWRFPGRNGVIRRRTLEPDLITITRDSGDHWHFVIWDAKYYDIKIEEGKLKNNPGVEDIAKQQLYQIAYADFAQKHKMKMGNAFLCPAQISETGKLFAETVLPVYDDWLAFNGKIELRPKVIKVYHISGDVLMHNYINGQTLPLAEIFDMGAD